MKTITRNNNFIKKCKKRALLGPKSSENFIWKDTK